MDIGTTLTHFLLEEERKYNDASGEFTRLMSDLTTAIRAISSAVNRAGIEDVLGQAGATNVQGEEQKKLDVLANTLILQSMEAMGHVAGLASEEMDEPYAIPAGYPKGKYLLVFDPLDGSSNIDVNISVGTIFSILKAPRPGVDATVEDFLQAGAEQVAAGYTVYGGCTQLIYSTGNGVHAFTLDPHVGEFVLANQDLKIPHETAEYAINASNRRFWEPAIQQYVQDCEEGKDGPCGKNFNMRWVGSMVADFHRILMRGGVFLYPRDLKKPEQPGKLRLLYEANPMGFLAEQAGGACTDGMRRMLDIQPESLHQRVPVVIGSKEEVDRVREYYEKYGSA
ncbi:fructose 1,6-bisphosphatase [Thiohalorhabdus denitrificans]|uniref:Fructose-1,6-bisphosphatase class 1 n=1 Tax=Thiohalorhabdus denitrificans TaxID=381306 RepID=A0A0P9EG04_9GAMM|nr:class 1 fructose-bisphosphatase [Thiohalorhabdus denitrificans]KPV41412.1 fructose 1,6-bisphosphatase [Thiohalorhabdus denitrificans]SCY26414.1 D-fructose 1,6-bisphosphatase [Thiohalorhabdus denitrificans]